MVRVARARFVGVGTPSFSARISYVTNTPYANIVLSIIAAKKTPLDEQALQQQMHENRGVKYTPGTLAVSEGNMVRPEASHSVLGAY